MTREEAIFTIKHRNGIMNYGETGQLAAALDIAIAAMKAEPCEDAISRKSIKQKLQEHHDFFVNAYGGFSNLPQNDKSRVDEITNCIAMVVNEPPVTPKPTECEDAVSREAVLNMVYRSLSGRNVVDFDDIKDLPPVTPKQRTGKWIKTPKAVMGEGYMWYCDKCEHQVYQDSSRDYPSEKYCPNCGSYNGGDSNVNE